MRESWFQEAGLGSRVNCIPFRDSGQRRGYGQGVKYEGSGRDSKR